MSEGGSQSPVEELSQEVSSSQDTPASPIDDSQQSEDTPEENVVEEVVSSQDVLDTSVVESVETSEDGPASETSDRSANDAPGTEVDTRSRSGSPVAAASPRDDSPAHQETRKPVYSDDDDEDETPKKKKKPILESDDEDDDDVQQAPEAEKKRRVLMSSDDDESGNEEGTKRGLKKKLLGSDVSDSEDDGDNDKPRGEEEVGELMANIFGDDSDEEGGGGGGDGDGDRPAANDDDNDEGVDDQQRYRREDRDEDPGFEWDFDTMLRNKKAEKRKKKRRRDGGIDIINDDDGTIAAMVEAMKAATNADRNSNMQRQPALRKRKMLPEVKTMLLRVDMMEAMIDNGMMSAVSDWLSPLPDKSLPALEIRTELLKLLQGFSRLEQSILKQSGLGKAVMMLYKHPREVKTNKEIAARLIREWARPIFQLETDFRSVSKEERVQRDLEHMPQIKKRRLSSEAGPSGQSGSGSLQDDLRPGDKGYIGRARVPRASTRDYVVRPRSMVEGEFKGERKGKGFNRLEKTQRDFLERTKKHKAKRAVNVSLEGRNMAL